MINHFNTGAQQLPADKADSNMASPGKQASKKFENTENDHSNVSFKQSFKPQTIGTLSFNKKVQDMLNSRGVTPSGQ